MTEEKLSKELKNTSYELFIGALSVLSIANIFLLYIFPLAEILEVLRVMNAILSIIFYSRLFISLLHCKFKKRLFYSPIRMG
jgi:hypothetical protein